MTVVLEQLNTGKILITSDYPMRDKELLKALPGSTYSVKTHQWTAPLTWATCITSRSMFGDRLEIGPGLLQWSLDHYENHIAPAMAMRQAVEAPGDEDLYPFQRAGVAFLKYAERALLCDEMGTGKTPQTVRTLKALVDEGKDPFPALVIAPKNMVLTWVKEIKKFWPDGPDVAAVTGSAAVRRKIIEGGHDVLVVNFEGVRAHSRLSGYGSVRLKQCYECDPMMPHDLQHSPARCETHAKEFNKLHLRTIVVDEAHRMKDPKSKQSMAIKALRTPETKYVYALSGTPIADSPIDLWPSLNLISPNEFSSRTAYIDRFCLQSFNMFGGMQIVGLNPQTKDEFFKIVDPHMRRMPKAAVLPFLPKKTYSRRYLEMDPKQAKAYKQMDDNMIAVLEDKDGGAAVAVAANPLTALTRLTQFSSSYAEVDEEGRVRLQAPSNKIDALIEWLEDNPDEPAVVFAQSRQLIDLASKALTAHKVSHSLIVGQQTMEDREQSKEDFQAGRVRAILCTISAGGIGITLTRSKVAIFLQRSWSMIENKQAEDRVHRIGAEIHDKISIIDFVSDGTVEEAQQLALEGKVERLEELMRDRATVDRILSDSGSIDETLGESAELEGAIA